MSESRRNTATTESRDFWEFADASAREVQEWPAWKRAGINVTAVRDADAQRDESQSERK